MDGTHDVRAHRLADALEEARQRARSERARYFELFDLAPVGLAVTDKHGTLREVNRAMADLLAIGVRQLLRKPLAVFVRFDERHDFRERLVEAARNPGIRSWETVFQRRDGQSRTVQVTVTPTLSGPRRLEDLRWVLHDVTERIDAEAAIRDLAASLERRVAARTAELEEERARLEAVVDKMPAGVVIVDGDGRVVRANDRAREILGAPAIATLGWPTFHIDGRPYEAGEFPVDRTLQNGERVSGERMELAPPDRPRITLDVSAAPIVDSSGAVLGAVSLVHDVTAQERRERAEREFVTNAAHQLQSPLAGILSALEVLQGGAKDRPERDMFLGHIEREARRLAGLTRGLLILARAQMGFEAPKDEVVAIGPLLQEVASSLRPASDVAVEVSCPSRLAVITNRELVEQAILNVADNAAKYTLKGRIVLGAEPAGDAAEIFVRDTGPGIPPEEQPLVLDRFYRTSRNGVEGFGLGFAIVRSAMDALEGDLGIESDPGAGTTVRIRLPRAVNLVET